MKAHFSFVFAAMLLILTGYSMAQNAIGIREFVLEPAKTTKEKPDLQPYILRLKLRCTLASQEIAYLKVAIDPKEEQNFVTVAEKRLRKGNGIPMDLEIPIEDWKTSKLNVYLLMLGKTSKPDDAPLANVTKTIVKASIKKE